MKCEYRNFDQDYRIFRCFRSNPNGGHECDQTMYDICKTRNGENNMSWKDDSKAIANGKYLKLESGDRATIKVLDEPVMRMAKGFDEKLKKSYDFPVQCKEYPNIESMSAFAGSMLLRALNEEDEIEPIIGRWMVMIRTGSAKDTKYTFRQCTPTRQQDLEEAEEEQPQDEPEAPRRAPAKKRAIDGVDEELRPRPKPRATVEDTTEDSAPAETTEETEEEAELREARELIRKRKAAAAKKAAKAAPAEEEPLVERGGFKPCEPGDNPDADNNKPAKAKDNGMNATLAEVHCFECGAGMRTARAYIEKQIANGGVHCGACGSAWIEIDGKKQEPLPKAEPRKLAKPPEESAKPILETQTEDEKPKVGPIERETPAPRAPRTRKPRTPAGIPDRSGEVSSSGRKRQPVTVEPRTDIDPSAALMG